MHYTEPFFLSSNGSTRATAYGMGNKIVTLDDKTHVVWLYAVANVRGRTYDHASRSWGDTIDLFEGFDNHTHPVLTADADGHLHLVYGPHGWWGNWNQARFMHVVSERPNSLEGWKNEASFGYNATYASMVSTPSGHDCIVYRGGEPPSSVMFQRQRPQGGWTTAKELMAQDISPQYTHMGAVVVSDADGTLYVGAHFYNDDTDGRSNGVAALKSMDLGETWTDLRGEPVSLPIRYDARFAIPGGDVPGTDVRLGRLALAPDGKLWVSTSGGGGALLSRWTGTGWDVTDLAPFLPEDRAPAAGPLVIDSRGNIHLVTNLHKRDTKGETWGHPSIEVFHLLSRDRARTFECHQVSTADDTMANWLPSISTAGPFHPVESPVITYTRGVPGEGCSPPDETEVYCVMIEDQP